MDYYWLSLLEQTVCNQMSSNFTEIVGSILEKENTDDGVWLKLLDEALRLISSLHSDYLGGIEKTKCITVGTQLIFFM